MNLHQFANIIWIATWGLRQTVCRYREAFAYARDRLDMTVANSIIYNCQAAAGWYPLEALSIDSCLQTARDVYWNDHPELENLVQSACAAVSSKWISNGHAADVAEDWALDLIPEYAEARGITLTRLADEPIDGPSSKPALALSPAEIVPDKPG